MGWIWFLFSFRGRINRKPFVIFWLVFLVVLFGLAVLLGVLSSATLEKTELYTGCILTLAVWPILAVQTKRWHDRGKSAWWIFINAVPHIGFLWFIIECSFGRGESGSNRFGSDPLETPGSSGTVEPSHPVLLLVLLIFGVVGLSFDAYRIPSNAMMPTLLTGDFIIASPVSYGIPMPFTSWELLTLSDPRRGDVIIFRYPEDPAVPFIKRVVGVPGDTISYINNTLTINGKIVEQDTLGKYTGHGSGITMTGAELRKEHLGSDGHQILTQDGYSTAQVTEVVVPKSQFFVLGDNRDNSRDSRYWGFVPRDHLMAKVRWVYLHWDWGHGLKLERTGTVIR